MENSDGKTLSKQEDAVSNLMREKGYDFYGYDVLDSTDYGSLLEKQGKDYERIVTGGQVVYKHESENGFDLYIRG